MTGAVTLNGGTVQTNSLPASFQTRTLSIVNATGGVTGAFSSVATTGDTGPAFGSPRLRYDSNNAYLVYDPNRL